MLTSMILDTWLCCMCVWCMYLWCGKFCYGPTDEQGDSRSRMVNNQEFRELTNWKSLVLGTRHQTLSYKRITVSCNGQWPNPYLGKAAHMSYMCQWSLVKNYGCQTIEKHWFLELLTKPPSLIKGCLWRWSRASSWNKAGNRSPSMGVFYFQVVIGRRPNSLQHL